MKPQTSEPITITNDDDRTVRYLSCPLTESEQKEAAKRLASLMQRGEDLETQLKQVKRQMESDIAQNEAAISKQREMVATDTEFRDVECKIERDWARNIKYFYRTDTGELVGEEPISDLERQRKLGENLVRE